MKALLQSALALLGAIGITVTADGVCDLTKIHAALATGTNTTAALKTSEPACLEATGYSIFNVSSFPTLKQAQKAQGNSDCGTLINLVNGNANVASQCTIQVNGTEVIYGHLISSFINGKTGNESDSGSASAGVSSKSASGSESESGSNSSSHSASHSGSSTTTLSFVTYGAIAAIAVALR